MVDQRDAVIAFISTNGPVLPVHIAKHIDTNILFSSAILAELVERKKLKITHFSVGGSPLYYLPGQEDGMDAKLSATLSGREKDAYNIIKERKVVRESDLEPWQRVAIKSLKDFTLPVSVLVNEGQNEVFWKYHLVNDEDAKLMIRELMHNVYSKNELISNSNHETMAVREELLQSNIEETKNEFPVQETNNVQPNIDVVNQDTLVKEITEKIRSELLKEIKPEKNAKLEVMVKNTAKEEKLKQEVKIEGKFYTQVIAFLWDNKITILKEELVKKDREIDFLVEVPSAFGNLRYFLKAKNKANISDSDLSVAFSDGQVKNLPVILLVNGKVSKKANSMMEQKLKGKIVLKHIQKSL